MNYNQYFLNLQIFCLIFNKNIRYYIKNKIENKLFNDLK